MKYSYIIFLLAFLSNPLFANQVYFLKDTECKIMVTKHLGVKVKAGSPTSSLCIIKNKKAICIHKSSKKNIEMSKNNPEVKTTYNILLEEKGNSLWKLQELINNSLWVVSYDLKKYTMSQITITEHGLITKSCLGVISTAPNIK